MTRLGDRLERLRRVRRNLDRETGQLTALATNGKRLQGEIETLTAQVEDYRHVAALLTTIGENRQADAQKVIETLVTQGLQTIFGDDLTFHLVPAVRANRPEIDFVVRSRIDNTTVDTPVLDARGGGLTAVVGCLLRIVVLLLSGRRDTPLILDETFAHVSAEYEPRLGEFLRELVDKTGIQIIMVTHSEAFTDLADTRYRFHLVNGVTKVEAL